MLYIKIKMHFHNAYNYCDQPRNKKSKQNSVRRPLDTKKSWYSFVETKFHLTEALGFVTMCVIKSISQKLLAKHTIHIKRSMFIFFQKKRSLFMEEENNWVKTMLWDKFLFWEASSNSFLMFYRLQKLPHIYFLCNNFFSGNYV